MHEAPTRTSSSCLALRRPCITTPQLVAAGATRVAAEAPMRVAHMWASPRCLGLSSTCRAVSSCALVTATLPAREGDGSGGVGEMAVGGGGEGEG
jgi:hypothetical protein